jgi:hypothetical protein
MSLPHRRGYRTAEDARRSKAFTSNSGTELDENCPCGLVHVRKPAAPVRPVLPAPRRIPIRAVSAARTAENRLRRKMVAELWPDGRPACCAPRCPGQADVLHEPLTSGGGLSGREFALCRRHFDMITFHPEPELQWARDLGLLTTG